MPKIELKAAPLLLPMPAVLVGATVKGKPNFLTVGFCGVINLNPPVVAIGLGRAHYTNPGIHEHKCFSVNIPSAAMAKKVDFCGMYSGHREDKSEVFEVFYGKLEKAPLIVEAPINLECRLKDVLPYQPDEVFIGEIVSVYASEECMDGELPDVAKVDPLCFCVTDKKYYRMTEAVGRAWSMGKKER